MDWQHIGPVSRRAVFMVAFKHFIATANAWRSGDRVRRKVLEDAYYRLLELCVENSVDRARLQHAMKIVLDLADLSGVPSRAGGD